MQSFTKNDPSDQSSHNPAILRYAELSDVDKIKQLLVPYAAQGIMLYKDKKKIEHDLPHTVVYIQGDRLLGVANLYPYDDRLYEVRGLAIDPEFQKSGIGKKLILKLLTDLKENNPGKTMTVFALTVVPDFFLKLGWKIVPKENFPQKIFDDCSFCVRRNECFEDAVEIVL